MADGDLRTLERTFLAAPDDPAARDALIAACRRAGKDPPHAAIVRLDRWRGLVDHVARFHGRPLEPGDGSSSAELDAADRRLGRRLPPAVREWYLLVGSRSDVLEGHCSPVRATQLTIEDGLLTLYRENQGAIRWGIRERDLDREDPAVVGDEDPDSAQVWNERVSAFCWQIATFQRVMGRGPHRGSGDVRSIAAGSAREAVEPAVAGIAARYPRLPLPGWPWDPRSNEECVLFFGDDEALLVLETGAPSIRVVGRSRLALQRVRSALAGICDFFD